MQTDVSRQRTPVNVDSFNAPQRGGLSGAAVVLPLRLFLGISFLAAGIEKLTDPEFFNPSAFNYIGNQLTGFAGQSPLGGFLRDFAVPNATLFGWMTVLGELAIGIATLVGLLTRTSAFFGLVLSLTLWLTATWTVTPFFLGSDLPYALGWLTLLIAGAHPILSLDGQIAKWRANRRAAATVVEGSPADSGLPVSDRPMMAATVETPEQRAALARRRFIMVAGGTAVAGALSGVAWYNSLANKKTATVATNTPAPSATATAAPANTVAPATSAATAPVTSATTAATSTTTAPATSATTVAPATTAAPVATTAAAAAPAGSVLEKLANIPAGSAKVFKTPDTNESAILVHNTDGVVTAFSSVCTHQGCDVAFNAAVNALACPCHGAQFDPKTGAATRGPANRPLKNFKVQVDASGNIVYLKA